MFNGVEHTAIASPDPEQLAAWYRATLEFTVIRNAEGTVFLRGRNGSLVEIITSIGSRGSNRRTDPGIRHLAIGVDDFDSSCACLRDRGIPFMTEPTPGPGNRIVFFEDPDGNILHLIERREPLL